MKQTTKRYLGIAAASALVIGVASGVFAQAGFGPGYGPGLGQGCGGPGGMMGGPGGMMGNPGRMPAGPGRMMGGPRGMRGPGGGPGCMQSGDPVASTEQRLSGLKSALEITADQEAAWNAYAEAVKGKAGLMLDHRQNMMGSAGVAPEQRFAYRQQGLEQMQRVTTTGRDLYNVLTPEQQTRAGNLLDF
ncbi:MAG: Spy/CpxP family protein refolding chaperone [Chromatiaceae bacterium]|nr:Spy/CpxP family protein refolding chaperone [Gammaproteobacteria bacterium]MCB1862438.1 Spy/CpxP family protein refolding chaperone [Gammaproteobacteria bacterium]MCB1881394.1 Spy/CpxP family protein refolding chaperone [Gammaproteobacteria bacterium]MCB1904816.1 Spy/CpxP family protein refolding chaperone [Gammaproteobacteria bacterium]MCP5446320.1 Spy/CpxP family protein refolding chaperone [Chromatiaceae bacterium]